MIEEFNVMYSGNKDLWLVEIKSTNKSTYSFYASAIELDIMRNALKCDETERCNACTFKGVSKELNQLKKEFIAFNEDKQKRAPSGNLTIPEMIKEIEKPTHTIIKPVPKQTDESKYICKKLIKDYKGGVYCGKGHEFQREKCINGQINCPEYMLEHSANAPSEKRSYISLARSKYRSE